MRIIAVGLLTVMVSFAVWLWGFGGADHLSRWAAETQRDVQNAMAGSIRALRAGESGALMALWGVCLTYGFVHAAGPGHGKLVIGGYGMGVRVRVRRLVGLAALSSIAQSMTAIIFVTLAVTLFDWSRAQMTEVADRTMAPFSYALIAAVGFWLILRGLRKARRLRAEVRSHGDHDHNSHHGHDNHGAHGHHHTGDDGVCSSCGHAHAPTPAQAAAVKSWRDAVAVVAAIAIRPCTGAVFLLIMTYALGIYWAGVIGTVVMGLGTAGFTMLVAAAAVSTRESALAQAASSRATAILLVCAELLAGLIIAAIAIQLLLRLT